MNRYRMVVRAEVTDPYSPPERHVADLELDEKGPLVLYEAHVAELGAERKRIRERLLQDIGVIDFDDWRDVAAVQRVIDHILPGGKT